MKDTKKKRFNEVIFTDDAGGRSAKHLITTHHSLLTSRGGYDKQNKT